ncbi:MAG: hypothetical protein KGL39_22690 [Patescibacteria group bacterium]|nr:hypothetical protein [Patescibacteria group bacterium]
MSNRVTRGNALVGKMSSSDGGAGIFMKSATVARTDTTAKTLFTLPAEASIEDITISGDTASDAGTTATVSVGVTGTSNKFVNAQSVKTAGLAVPAAKSMGNVGSSQITVVGIYAETGTASTTGGPWTIRVFYTLN